MMAEKKDIVLLAALISLLIFANYGFIDKKLADFTADYKTGMVERVIDGDTIVLQGGEHVRLLGINTPEKKEPYYGEAKMFLESLVLNKTVKIALGKEERDLYNRTLGYVVVGGENANFKIVENGFGNFYFPSGKDRHYGNFKKAWEKCVQKGINLCEKSADVCGGCVKLEELDWRGQKAVFYNACPFSCDLTGWEIKDEGRKKFSFPYFILESRKMVSVITGNEEGNESSFYWKKEDYVWTGTGDTLFLRDSEGRLVLWKNY
jgi:micrococcal nuclease